MNWRILITAIIFQACAISALSAMSTHTITLSNGDRITGEVLGVQQDNWVVQTTFMGKVNLPVAQAQVLDAQGNALQPNQFPVIAAKSKKDKEAKSFTVPGIGTYVLPKGWAGELSVGVTDVSGTSEKRNIAWNSKLDMPWGKNEISWSTFYKYSESSNKKDVDNYGTALRYRRELDKRSFIQSRTTYSQDHIQGIDDQLDQTLGYGYAVIKTDTMEFNVVPGMGYQYINQPGTEDGGALAYNFFEDFSWEIIEELDFEHSFNIFVPSDETSNYNYLLTNGLKTMIGESYLVRITHEYDYDNKVAPGREKYTSTFSTSLGYSF